jgi:hypothetical protein
MSADAKTLPMWRFGYRAYSGYVKIFLPKYNLRCLVLIAVALFDEKLALVFADNLNWYIDHQVSLYPK